MDIMWMPTNSRKGEDDHCWMKAIHPLVIKFYNENIMYKSLQGCDSSTKERERTTIVG